MLCVVPCCVAGEVKIISVRQPVPVEPHRETYQDPSNAFSSSLQNSRSKTHVEILSAPIIRALRAYVPQCVLQKVDAGQVRLSAVLCFAVLCCAVLIVNVAGRLLECRMRVGWPNCAQRP
jgi:hypothetical protein